MDPEIVVNAVEEATAVATRKHYKSQDNMRAELNKETGAIQAYSYRTVVETPEQIEDPNSQVTLEDARRVGLNVEVGVEIRQYKLKYGVLGRYFGKLVVKVIVQKVS